MSNTQIYYEYDLSKISELLFDLAENQAKSRNPNKVFGWYHDVISRKFIIDEFSQVLNSPNMKALFVSLGLIPMIESIIPNDLRKAIIQHSLFGMKHQLFA